jgi:hypothetical protein
MQPIEEKTSFPWATASNCSCPNMGMGMVEAASMRKESDFMGDLLVREIL